MENKKDINVIRKFINLVESFEKTDFLNEENPFVTLARTEKLVAGELESALKAMKGDSKIAGELSKVGIRNADELLKALKLNNKKIVTPSIKGSLELHFLKTGTANTKLIDAAAESLVKNNLFRQKYAPSMLKGQVEFEKALKSAGYSDRAITSITQKTKNITPQELQSIVKGTPSSVAKDVKAGETAGASVSKNTKGAEVDAKMMKDPASPSQAAMAMKEGEGAIKTSKAKEAFNRAKERLTKMKPEVFQSYKRIRKFLRVKRLLFLGLMGATAYYLWDRLWGDGTTLPDFDDCVTDLIPNNGGTMTATSSGDPVILLKTTGNQEYDNKGGLKFFTNKRVWMFDDSKSGTWSCGGSDKSQLQTAPLSEANAGSGLKNINIVWDQQGGNTDDNNKKRTEPEYKKCTEFPYAFGCISEDIANLQGCLNITPQKGYFGPKTKRTLESLGYNLSNGITQEIFKDIQTNKCSGKVTTGSTVTTGTTGTTGTTVTTGNTPTPEPKPDYGPVGPEQPEFDKDKTYFDEQKKSGNLFFSSGRWKYKGPSLMDAQGNPTDNLKKLDRVLISKGFGRLKQPKIPRGYKYVWARKAL